MTEHDIIKYIDMVVDKTVKALKKNDVLKNGDDVKYADISYMLIDYYQNGQNVPKIESALDMIKADDYFEIIPMYYGDRLSIGEVAKRLNKDTSTIVRNKKRLCLQVYTSLI